LNSIFHTQGGAPVIKRKRKGKIAAKHTYESWMHLYSGLKVEHADKDKLRREAYRKADDAVFSKIHPFYNLYATKHYHVGFENLAGERCELKIAYNNCFSLGGETWTERKATHLFTATQNKIKQQMTPLVCHFMQESRGLYRFLTLTRKSGHVAPDKLRAESQKLKKQFRYLGKHLLKVYGIEILLGGFHFDLQGHQCNPHIHAIVKQHSSLSPKKWQRITALISKIGQFDLSEPISSKEATTRYIFKIQDYSNLGSWALRIYYSQLKGFRTFELYNSLKKHRATLRKASVTPRAIKGIYSSRYELVASYKPPAKEKDGKTFEIPVVDTNDLQALKDFQKETLAWFTMSKKLKPYLIVSENKIFEIEPLKTWKFPFKLNFDIPDAKNAPVSGVIDKYIETKKNPPPDTSQTTQKKCSFQPEDKTEPNQ